jgi:O-acetylhomoserine/O-acetylserine sulfhydrylase-like pyridoxal-dependent enzyme
MRVGPLQNLGACISPDNAWLFLQGIEDIFDIIADIDQALAG